MTDADDQPRRTRPRTAGARRFALAAALLAACGIAEALWRAAHSAAGDGGGRPLQSMLFGLLALATTLPLALGRRQAGVAAVVSAAAMLLSLIAFHTLTVAGMIALLTTGFLLGRTGAWVVAMVFAVPFPLLALLTTVGSDTVAAPVGSVAPTVSPVGEPADEPAAEPAPERDGLEVAKLALACLAPAAALAGVASRARRDAKAGDAVRQVYADTLLEHVARGERARIARELHDVVAHHISMVAVQAETARLAVPGMPDAGAERLRAIGDTARTALTEMRHLLTVLREDADADAPERHPQPTLRLEELDALLGETRDATGAPARLTLTGTPTPLDAGLELAAYRIIQEALTNARRHAPGAAVDVELGYGERDLTLRIRDSGPGPGATASAAGHGLAGMRERAAAAGGTLHAGQAPGGGFLVEATLPLDDTLPAGDPS
ncbi:sensor histidine kinase [Nonomuraea sp. NBC_01738]|uniref:sensor histidine kinase n=1 Tax=Nonomuraea sp. NBC_01738 TaxID=2976003 RepID=UPI002E120866|nr:sensor histidine kinase [Nonomuraea sp. NBC_01738]